MTDFEWNLLKKVIRSILCIICLCEEKIEYYHSKKKLIKIIIIDLLLISIIDIFISLFTYVLIILFNKKIALSFTPIFILYYIILGIITFKNLLYKDFNLAKRVRLLVFSMIDKLTIRDIFKEILFSFVVFLILAFLLIYFIGDYVVEKNINDINMYMSFKIITFGAAIITLIIYVYGTNNLYIGYKRKFLLYGTSTIIVVISTIDSLKEMYNSSNISNIDFKLMALIFTLIMSVDKCISAYTNLISEYSKDEELIEKKRMELIKEINENFKSVAIMLQKYLKLIKRSYFEYKSASNEVKRRIYIYFAVFLFFVVVTDEHMPFMIIIKKHIGEFIYNIGLNGHEIQGRFLRLICFSIKIIFIIVISFNCVKIFLDSISNMKKMAKKKLCLVEIKKEALNLLESETLFMIALISPIIFFDINILRNIIVQYIINLIKFIILITSIFYSACFILNKVKERVNKYKE